MTKSKSILDKEFNAARRAFGKAALYGAMGAPSLFAMVREGMAEMPKIAPGVKICVQSPPAPTDDDLLFLKQLGVQYVSVGSSPELRTAEGFQQIRKRYADAGVTVWNIGNT